MGSHSSNFQEPNEIKQISVNACLQRIFHKKQIWTHPFQSYESAVTVQLHIFFITAQQARTHTERVHDQDKFLPQSGEVLTFVTLLPE